MNIEWTEPAVSDLESIKDYIARDSVPYASRFVEKVIEAVENIKGFPEIGRKIPEIDKENIRELLVHNYRIIYRVETERILILSVIHTSRDLSSKKPKIWDIT
ncbi:MAG: type II toxin-antitoxin system RelE/ParE family toxin [Candidatus Stahlbacteria bacterium]|nr:type II toxin-antitoxin system RelE/ParE family toxin [Candidatus Stahlbacteria bacterium]